MTENELEERNAFIKKIDAQPSVLEAKRLLQNIAFNFIDEEERKKEETKPSD